MLFQVSSRVTQESLKNLWTVLLIDCLFLGMVGVGGFFIMGGGLIPHTFPQALGALSVLLAFVNVSGGFVITKRMLDMFKRTSRFLTCYNFLGIYSPC